MNKFVGGSTAIETGVDLEEEWIGYFKRLTRCPMFFYVLA
jgi:hypothetical protein